VRPALEGRARTVVRVELAVMAFATALPGIVIGLNGLDDPETVTTDIDTLTLIASLLASFGPAALAVFLLWRDGQLRAAGFERPRPGFFFAYAGLAFAAAIGAVLAMATIIAVAVAIFGDPTDDGPVGPAIEFSVGSLVAAFAISATAGISEEVVYRGYGITRMEQAGWPRAALVVPLLVWTVQHLYAGLLAPLVVGAVGIPFVWIFWWKRSVWPLVAAHFLYDFVIFLLNTG
jgi:membrane protease YdiL (CAAX protease family)